MKKLILWGILVFALIIGGTILTIYIARGYRFIDNQVVTTAILQIDSNPRGAKILIDGENAGNTPKQITGISEGTHNIEIQRDGFTTWKKSITVTGGNVRELSIKLFPLSFNLEQLTQTNIDKTFFSSDGTTGVYVVTDNNFETGLYRIKFEKSLFEFTAKDITRFGDLAIIPDQNLRDGSYVFEISPNNRAAMLTIEQDQKNTFYLFDNLDLKYSALPQGISEQIGYLPTTLSWGEDENTLILTKPNLIVLHSLREGRSQLLHYVEDTESVIYSKNVIGEIVLVQKESSVKQDNSDNIISTITFKFFAGSNIQSYETQLNSTEPIHVTSVYLNDTEEASFFFQDDKQRIYYYNSEIDVVSTIKQTGNVVSISPNGSGILFQNDKDVFTARVELNTPRNLISIETFKIGSYDESIIRAWYPFSDSIISYNRNSNLFSIADIDGGNKYDLLTETVIDPPSGWISNIQGEQIIISVMEQKSDDNSSPSGNKNLYRIPLK